MTYVIRIETNGDVIRMDDSITDLTGVAERALAATVDVVTLHLNAVTPFPGGGDPYLVGVVDGWGRSKGMPVNLKAWALYGRSPLCGPCFVAYDTDGPSRPALPDEWITAIEQPFDSWMPARYQATMKQIAMAEGVRWPA